MINLIIFIWYLVSGRALEIDCRDGLWWGRARLRREKTLNFRIFGSHLCSIAGNERGLGRIGWDR
jgi:hypothetical protein